MKKTTKLFFIILTILFCLLIKIFLINDNYLYYLNTSTKGKDNKLLIYIEVDKNKLSLIDRNTEESIKTFTIATGKISSPTPLGNFNIIEKAAWGEGFGSRWIGLYVPWGKYGIHGTNKPGSIGYNLSKGCVRMRNKDIEELFDLIDYDTCVLIENGNFGPFGNGFRDLRPGDRGSDVLEVQKRLNQKGDFELSLDGIYGENMKKSLISFLKTENIDLTDKITFDIYEKLDIILMD